MNSNDTSMPLPYDLYDFDASDGGDFGFMFGDGFPNETQVFDFANQSIESYRNEPDPPCYYPDNPSDSGGMLDSPSIINFKNVKENSTKAFYLHSKVFGSESQRSSAPIDVKLNDAMLCNGKKLPMKQKIAIFNFALDKLNEKGNGCTIRRLNREETRSLAKLDNRLKEILPFLEYLKANGSRADFLKLLSITHPIQNL